MNSTASKTPRTNKFLPIPENTPYMTALFELAIAEHELASAYERAKEEAANRVVEGRSELGSYAEYHGAYRILESAAEAIRALPNPYPKPEGALPPERKSP